MVVAGLARRTEERLLFFVGLVMFVPEALILALLHPPLGGAGTNVHFYSMSVLVVGLQCLFFWWWSRQFEAPERSVGAVMLPGAILAALVASSTVMVTLDLPAGVLSALSVVLSALWMVSGFVMSFLPRLKAVDLPEPASLEPRARDRVVHWAGIILAGAGVLRLLLIDLLRLPPIGVALFVGVAGVVLLVGPELRTCATRRADRSTATSSCTVRDLHRGLVSGKRRQDAPRPDAPPRDKSPLPKEQSSCANTL